MKAVVFFPRTGACRVFNSYNLAQEYYPSLQPMTRKEDLIKALPTIAEREFAYQRLKSWVEERGFNIINTDDSFGGDLETDMWHMMTTYGDHIDRAVKTRTDEGRMTKDGYTINLTAAKKVTNEADNYPPQAKAIAHILTDNQYDYYTKREMQRLMNSPKAFVLLKTRQDGWRIFRYYKRVLERANIIKETKNA